VKIVFTTFSAWRQHCNSKAWAQLPLVDVSHSSAHAHCTPPLPWLVLPPVRQSLPLPASITASRRPLQGSVPVARMIRRWRQHPGPIRLSLATVRGLRGRRLGARGRWPASSRRSESESGKRGVHLMCSLDDGSHSQAHELALPNTRSSRVCVFKTL